MCCDGNQLNKIFEWYVAFNKYHAYKALGNLQTIT